MRGALRSFVGSLLLGGVFMVAVQPLWAQEQSSGIKIIPASIEERADPGQVIEEKLTITNISGEDKTFYLFKQDIKGVEAGGVPIFAEENAERTGFELSEWVSIENEQIELAAGASYELPITITVPQNASPGSHFGGVFVSVEPPRLRELGAGVGYEVASIFSIRISGDVVDLARIRSISTDKLFYSSKDVDFLVKVENQGNILIRPRGPLVIHNMLGGQVTTLSVNDPLAGVFPNTIRDLPIVTWKDDTLGFGRYEATVALVYEGDIGQRTIDGTVTFWIVPTKVLIPVLIGLLALFAAIYIFTRIYIRRLVEQSGRYGGRRIVSRRYQRRAGISRFMFIFVTILSVTTLFLIILLILFA